MISSSMTPYGRACFQPAASTMLALVMLASVQSAECQTSSSKKISNAMRSGDKTFTTEGCYRDNFPLALKISPAMVPPEVRFFCAAPWNFAAFRRVRLELQRQHFDIVEAFVKMVPKGKRNLLKTTTNLAKDQAEKASPEFYDAWYVQRILPSLHAIKYRTDDAALVAKEFAAEDYRVLQTVATAIAWDQAAFSHEYQPKNRTGTGSPTLAQVPKFIGDAYKN